MGFLAGMIVGGMMSHRDPDQGAAARSVPTLCAIAENYQEYRTCRWPEIWDQLHTSNSQNALFCDRQGDKVPIECSLDWRTGMEWRGILRLRGITPR